MAEKVRLKLKLRLNDLLVEVVFAEPLVVVDVVDVAIVAGAVKGIVTLKGSGVLGSISPR